MKTTSTATPMPWTRGSRALLPDAMRLGPVRLAVADLDRAINFYVRVVGLTVEARGREGEHNVAHLHAGGEDVVVLQEERGARPNEEHRRHAGLYHVALNYPTRLELARALRRIAATRTPIGAADHATHEAIYLADPDGNGLELAWDRPREQWPQTVEDYVRVGRSPLDIDGLLALTPDAPVAPQAAPGLRVGHVHLHVGSIERAADFYVDRLGLELQLDMGTADFTSAGAYHHHLAFNTWRGEGVPPAPPGVVGLREWRMYLPTEADVVATRARLEAGNAPVTPAGDGAFVTADPWGIPLYVGVDPTTVSVPPVPGAPA